jgi:PhzF family phenazine biosynthesis protein
VTLKLWQIDAFASRVLEGNPAAVVPLTHWLDDGLMQKIAGENNLAETAFFVKTAPGHYDLRWFTPNAEVDLCGHATLASAWLIFDRLEPDQAELRFMTRSGELMVTRGPGGRHIMSLPSDFITPYISPANVAQQIGEALGAPSPTELLKGVNLVAVWEDPKIIRGLKGPGAIARVLYDLGIWGLIVTAPSDAGYDFVSRFFAPAKGVPEDPVTGSAHCALTPYWSHRLGKKQLKARQVSPRGGDILCTDNGLRTVLEGTCALYLEGEITV